MGSRGASHPKKRRTDPAAEHCDPYELVDRAREGALDESTRRRLTMVLRSQRDAALELAWMQLFDEVREPPRRRERREEERSEHERTDRVVRQIVARLGATATPVDDGSADDGSADDARTRRWPAVDAEGRPIDEDARTRRWQAIPTHPDRHEELDEHPTKLHAVLRDVTTNVTQVDAMTFDPTPLDPTPLDSIDDAHTGRWASVDATFPDVTHPQAPPRAQPPRPRRTGQTAPWNAAPTLRRDPTPRSTPLDSRRRTRSWIALGLTAALSIATGWLAHGWWNAIEANDAPPVMASPPTSR